MTSKISIEDVMKEKKKGVTAIIKKDSPSDAAERIVNLILEASNTAYDAGFVAGGKAILGRIKSGHAEQKNILEVSKELV